MVKKFFSSAFGFLYLSLSCVIGILYHNELSHEVKLILPLSGLVFFIIAYIKERINAQNERKKHERMAI